MELLRVHSKEDLQANLVPGVWGIREPSVEYNGARRETGLYNPCRSNGQLPQVRN